MEASNPLISRSPNGERVTKHVPASSTASRRTPPVKFANRSRFVILLIVTLCLSMVLSNTLTLNFTVICMADPMPDIAEYNSSGRIHQWKDGTYHEHNSSYPSPLSQYEFAVASRRFAYTPTQKTYLFSAVAVGAMIAVYPSMAFIQKFGTRITMFAFGILSAVVTGAIPLGAYLGFWYLVALRVLQGTALGMTFSVIGICTQNWSMAKQSALFLAVLSCFFQIGPIFTMPVAGSLCTSSWGWTSVYYLHAIITVILFGLFYAFYREFPAKHFCVSDKELDRIHRGKDCITGEREKVPTRDILSTHAVYAIWISAIANFMGIQLTMQFSPIYLNKVLGFPVAMTGIFSSIPQIVTFVVKIAAGVLSDQATCCTPLNSVKIFNTIALAGMGVFFVALAFVPPTAPIVGLVLLIISTSIVGFNCGAFFKASQLMAKQHNHFIMGINSLLNCASTLLAPLIVNVFVTNETAEEWWNVWFYHGVLLVACNFYFCFFVKTEPAPWTQSAHNGQGCTVAAGDIATTHYIMEQEKKKENEMIA